MLKIKETYITIVDNRQVIKTVYENGQTTVYGSSPSNERPPLYRNRKLLKEKEK